MRQLSTLKLGPAAEFELRHWLGTLGAADADGALLALFRRASLARNGGPRVYHVCGARTAGPLALTVAPDWILRVSGEDATLRTLPFGQAWQLDVSELLAVLLEWFDELAPELAARLRAVNGEEMRRAPRSPTATASIAALAAITIPSLAAVESALGVSLALVRSGDGLHEHHADFASGAFVSAHFFHNRHTDVATMSVQPRVASPEALDARELGWIAAFDGFNFDRPGAARRQFRIDLGGRELRVIEPAGASPAPLVTIDWKAVRRSAPLPRCAAPPPGATPLTSFAALKTPGRYWITMRFDGDGWSADPPIKLPHDVAFRVELQNLGEFPGVAAHRRDRLRFHLDASARESRRVSGSDRLRETLIARVIDVCVDEPPDV